MSSQSNSGLKRPATLREVAELSDSLEAFGYNLRDWQHELARQATSRIQLARSFEEEPRQLAGRFAQGEVADAYLAAYAEWLAQEAKLEPPGWTLRETRPLATPWYSSSSHSQLVALAPEGFRRRGVFTVPENPFTPKRGRPRVPAETKRQKAIARQRAYRKRIKALVDKARSSGWG